VNIPENTLPEPLGFDDSSLRHDTLEKLLYGVGKDTDNATLHDLYSAVALTLRERLIGRWHETQRRIRARQPRKVYYLSLEFLMGRTLLNAAINLDLQDNARTLLEEIGVRLEQLVEEEQDAGLGNGGLGRLAACFLDSMATLDLAGFGYGIRYDYGLFEQRIGPEGEQLERPNNCCASVTSGSSAARICATRCASADIAARGATRTALPRSSGRAASASKRWPTTHRCRATTGAR